MMRNTLSIHELPEAEQEEIRKFMEAALIVCVDRAGGRLRIPVAEIDATVRKLTVEIDGTHFVFKTGPVQ